MATVKDVKRITRIGFNREELASALCSVGGPIAHSAGNGLIAGWRRVIYAELTDDDNLEVTLVITDTKPDD